MVSPIVDTAQICMPRDLVCFPHAMIYMVVDVGTAAEAKDLGAAGTVLDADSSEEDVGEYSARLLVVCRHILDHNGLVEVDRQQRLEARSRVALFSLHTREVVVVEVPSARLKSGYKNEPSFGYALLAPRPLLPNEGRSRGNDGSDCTSRPRDRSLERR